MLKRIIPLVVVGFLVIAFTVAPALALLPVGQTAPNFTLSDLSNNAHTLSNYRGKVVVFDFFTPYCGYCQQDAKNNLIPLYNTYYKNNANVQFFSIESSGASVSTIQSVYFAATGTIPWPVLRNGGSVQSAYGVGVNPTVYVIDPTGNVALAMPYPINVATLKSTIDRLLTGGSTPTTTKIAASTPTPTVGQTVTFTVNLNSGSTGLSKSVKIWHTANGQTWQDGTHATTNGVYSFTQAFGSTGQRIYHAEFAGDSSYGASSGTVTVNVGTTPKTTTTSISASTTNPSVGQTVTFTIILNSGSTGLSKSVNIWHTTDGVRWEDGTYATTNGIYSFTQAFGSTGQRIYHVEFAGDSSYGASSGTVTVNVSTTTTTSISASTTNPSVGQTVTFTVTLKSGTALLSGKTVTVYHFFNDRKYTDTIATTDSNGKITFTQTFGSTGQRPYYATFAGDSAYLSSTGWLTITVH